MDDFGTGYSSLSYLRSFPFDKIKIDRSFVHELATREDSMAIVRAVTGLGKSLGISIVAEGVETTEQLGLLRTEGCTEVQGFLFSRPRPAQEVEAMLSYGLERGAA
jgi:EAL domain-containing protein (putative c-di-GMP-specific phosphodiesterase class I)